ncbi:YIP1 family protein [Myxococcaceae bacterium JPH2]|nr:YIP1 family protein [Myxococcaceae bacterium JPH2]
MTSLAQPARVFVDPFEGTRVAVEARRWVWPLLILALCVSVSGTAFSLRWDATPSVLAEAASSGDLSGLSESELADKVQTASRKALVGGIAKGVFVMPLSVVLLAAVLWLCTWLFEKPAPFEQLVSAAALALLPIALYHLIFAVCAFFQFGLTEARAERLVPSSLAFLQGLSPRVQGLLKGADFFNLWSAALLGLGFSAATGMTKSRAVLLSGVLYAMYVGVFFVGLPAMGGGAK